MTDDAGERADARSEEAERIGCRSPHLCYVEKGRCQFPGCRAAHPEADRAPEDERADAIPEDTVTLAEVREQAARVYYRWMMGDDYPEFPWDDDNTPSNETKDEAERFAAEFALDRARDIRSDDNDERRAEIEAVILFACPECGKVGSENERCAHYVGGSRGHDYYKRVPVRLALDRVRDARGDDEGSRHGDDD